MFQSVRIIASPVLLVEAEAGSGLPRVAGVSWPTPGTGDKAPPKKGWTPSCPGPQFSELTYANFRRFFLFFMPPPLCKMGSRDILKI